MYTSVWNWQIKFRCHHYMWIIMIKSNILFRYRFQKILPYNAYMYVCRSLESARILVTQTSTKSAVLWKHWTLPRNMCESVGVRTRRWKTYLVYLPTKYITSAGLKNITATTTTYYSSKETYGLLLTASVVWKSYYYCDFVAEALPRG